MYSIKSSSGSDGIPTSSGNSDKIGDLVTNIIQLEDTYYEKLNLLIKEQKEIEKMISWLEPIERLLIRSKYIECNTWEDVCVAIGYSWRQTHRLHSSILKKLSEKMA